MARRQSEPVPDNRFAACAALLLAAAWNTGPAAAAATSAEMCDEASERVLEISGSQLEAIGVDRDIETSVIETHQSGNKPDALLPRNYLSPGAEPAPGKMSKEAKEPVPASPIADAPRVDRDEEPTIKARMPGVSDDELARYKRQMYRRDI